VNDPKAINVVQVVIEGGKRQTLPALAVMPDFGKAYSDDEIAAVANYVTARFGAAPSDLTGGDVRKLRDED
jgi:mono/diheme cytochrome c family protein